MTDISYAPPAGAATGRPARRRLAQAGRRPRFAPYAVALAGAGAGYVLGRSLGGGVHGLEPSLALLLRFMGAVKLLTVLGAACALHWRATHPVSSRAWGAYLVALAIMAPAPGLILSLGAVGVGALAFHLGMIVFLAVASRDDALPLRRRTRF